MARWNSYNNSWYGGGSWKSGSRRYWSGAWKGKEADRSYQVCSCGQWKYTDRKLAACDQCGEPWEKPGSGGDDIGKPGVVSVDGLLAALGSMLGTDEGTVRGALATLLPQPIFAEEQIAKESEFYKICRTARGKLEATKKKKKDAESKCAAAKKFGEAQANLDHYQAAETEAETSYHKAKAEWWKAYPAMAQSKEDFVRGRYAPDEEDDVFGDQEEDEPPEPQREQKPAQAGEGSAGGSAGERREGRSRSREKRKEDKAEQSAAKSSKRWHDEHDEEGDDAMGNFVGISG